MRYFRKRPLFTWLNLPEPSSIKMCQIKTLVCNDMMLCMLVGSKFMYNIYNTNVKVELLYRTRYKTVLYTIS